MAYNSGNFSLFSQTGFTSSTQIYGQMIQPQISPPAGAKYTNVYISYLRPSIQNLGITNVYGLSVGLTQNAANNEMLNAYSLFIQPPSVSSGTLRNVYSLFVADPSNNTGSAFAQQMYTAYIGGFTGIGTTSPKNMLDVAGSVVVGTFAGNIMAQNNNTMLVSGAVGVGTTNPVYNFDVQGIVNTVEILAPATTLNNQMAALSQGYNQGGLGSGLPGTQLVLSTSTTLAFDTKANVNANSKGFSGGIFDGRYIYMVPLNNGTYYGQITRFDTFSDFSSSNNYSVFDSKVLNSNSVGFSTASFDGRYVYFMSYNNGSTFTSQITRYDTTKYFTVTFSYSVFNVAANVSGDKKGYSGSYFDGKYVYFIAQGLEGITYFGTVLRYDISLPFTGSSGYLVFDTTLVSANSRGFFGGVYDGQYLYLVPYLQNTGSASSFVTQYDTTKVFNVSTSYSTFNLALVNTNCAGFRGAVFDGRFIYYCNSSFNFLTRYDTSAPFNASASYSVVNLGVANHWGGGFDGKFLYLVGPSLITRYDSSLPFTYGTSYSSLTITNSVSKGASFDGMYVYFYSGATTSGMITRMNANPGPPTTALSIGYSIGDFTVKGNLKLLVDTSNVASAGSGSLCPTQCSGFLRVNVNGTLQRIPYF